MFFKVAPRNEASRQFVFYPDLTIKPAKEGGVYPVSGTADSPTSLMLLGRNFSNAGQTIRCFFADKSGNNMTTLGTAVSDTVLKCETPIKPPEMSAQIYISVTGNMQQFTEQRTFMYYTSPVITRIHPTADTLMMPQLDPALKAKYNMPAGPVAGGTRITIEGLNIFSWARCPVLPKTGLIDLQPNTATMCAGGEGTCPTAIQCQFPFYYQPTGKVGKQRFDECTQLDVADKLPRAPAGTSWCMINYLKPGNEDSGKDWDGDTIFERSFVACDCWNPQVALQNVYCRGVYTDRSLRATVAIHMLALSRRVY
jgi:hypothetical protein